MSKKRFYIFGDNIRGNFGEVDKPLNNTEIVNLLNEQQATNSALKEENEQLRKQVAEYEMILRQHEFAEKEGFQ